MSAGSTAMHPGAAAADATRIAGIAVVVPARNEEALIADCLRSIELAVEHVEQVTRRIDVVTVVVDDDSSDATARLARRFAGVTVLHSGGGNVGIARARGVDYALELLAADRLGSQRIWITNTDADSAVPVNWLSAQLNLADPSAPSPADAIVGTIRPTFTELTPEQVEAWLELHEPGVANGNVHGANLGVRASAYLEAGGFRSLTEHEDVDLVHRLTSTGARIVASAEAEVVTSGRLWGRTPGGFAGYLRTQLVPRQSVVR